MENSGTFYFKVVRPRSCSDNIHFPAELLIKSKQRDVIAYFLNRELIPICLKTMQTGSEKCKKVSKSAVYMLCFLYTNTTIIKLNTGTSN